MALLQAFKSEWGENLFDNIITENTLILKVAPDKCNIISEIYVRMYVHTYKAKQ